jgi:hypothetical protein
MNRPAVENALRWMLAAWTLGASVFVAPTVVHGHVGGRRSHQHHPADCVPDGLSQSFLPEAPRNGYEGRTCLSAADFHRHRSFSLLEAVKYVPMPSEPVSPHGKSPCGWETIPVVSSARGLRACSHGVAGDHLQLASPADLSVECICQSGQHKTPAPGAAPSAPLCDRARHERSGVQLA